MSDYTTYANVMKELATMNPVSVPGPVMEKMEDKINTLHNQTVEIFERCNVIYRRLFDCAIERDAEKRAEPMSIDDKLSDISADAALTLRVLGELMERL